MLILCCFLLNILVYAIDQELICVVPKLKTNNMFWLLLYPDSTGGGGAPQTKENSIKTTVKNRHNTKV